MSSLKMTFSLASLILIFALVFAAMPVLAQAPTVTIADDGTTMRSQVKLKFTFSKDVSDDGTSVTDGFENNDANYRYYDKNGTSLGGGATNISTITETTGKGGKEYTATINMSSPETGAVGFEVVVPASAVIVGGFGNQRTPKRIGLPPALGTAREVVIAAVKLATDTDTSDGQDYTVTFTFKGTGDPGLTFAANTQIAHTPSYVNLSWRTTPTGAASSGNYVYTGVLTYNLASPAITIGLDPLYAAPGKVTKATIPVPPTTTVPTEPADKTDEIRIPTATSSSGAIDLGSRFVDPVIPAHGWAVLVRDVDASKVFPPTTPWIRSISTSLPDLALFFGGRHGINSGTISLHAPNHTHAHADHFHNPPGDHDDHLHDLYADHDNDVVISEIMWGLDYGDSVNITDPTCAQWIEFYNTTSRPIDLTGWKIHFHRSLVNEGKWENPPRATAGNVNDPDNNGTLDFYLVDIASNAGVTDRSPVHQYHHPWTPKGQSGTSAPIADRSNLTSMYLEINYTQPMTKKHVVPSGANADSWSASVYPQSNLPYGIVGTPGSATIVRIKYKKTPVSQTLLINEIGNSSNDAHDWIEIHNPGTADVNIENMMFTTVTNTGTDQAPVGKEEILFRFPKQVIKGGQYVVFTASDPASEGNDLVAGIDITKSDADQRGKGLGSHNGNTTAFYRIHGALKLPNPNTDKKRLYLLRRHIDDGWKNYIGAHPRAQENVVDVIGSLAISLNTETPSNWTQGNPTDTGQTATDAASTRRIFHTTLWPLQWSPVDDPPDNPKTVPHGKRVDGGSGALGNNKVYERSGKGLPNAENHLKTAKYTGIGYDRKAPANAGNTGTPGYANTSVVGERAAASGTDSGLKDQVSISEIMLATHLKENDDSPRIPRAHRLPQWIEIYNSSLTEGVNINGWEIEIQNADSEEFVTRDLHSTVKITDNKIIQPNQTLLIVSARGPVSDVNHFPETRVVDLSLKDAYRKELSLQNRDDPILSQVGFHVELRDSKGRFVDAVGNLPDATTRRGFEPRGVANYEPVWELPEMNHADGPRTSLIRIYDDGMPSDGMKPVATGDLAKGTEVGWRLAVDTMFTTVPGFGFTYYGNQRDYGTPGYRGGGPLPVSLSKFRPERLKETGEVVIRWITESELNNAGFNILRSETRDGKYTKINTQLIAGHGTTSERHTYEWKDTSAKPNVVYYYQIQDVSLDGRVTPLRMSRLKGNVNAAGKLSTKWAELKALQ